MNMSIITLLTDFGVSDEFVGVMKGVILSVNPAARIVDITHAVDPQDILQAAFLIHAAWSYFPTGTVHVVVIDPGVGSRRSIVAVQKEGHIFLAPDNGVLTLLLEAHGIEEAVRVENPDFFLHPVSDTFHGRDIFAPVSAHLSAGLVLRQLGTDILPRQLTRLSIPKSKAIRPNVLSGVILSVDRFGNLITNIHQSELKRIDEPSDGRVPEITIGNQTIIGIHRSFHQAPAGGSLAIIGSRRYLEIAVNRGNAAALFNAKRGDPVCVRWPEKHQYR